MKRIVLTTAVMALFVAALIAAIPQRALADMSTGHDAGTQAAKLAALFKSSNFTSDQGVKIPYRYYDPTAQKPEGKGYPVILYLHGEGETGVDNNAQLITTECATVWVEPSHLAKHPVYVLAPQIPKGSTWTAEPVYHSTLALLHQFVASHPKADTNRIYIVGFSMGATGLWKMLLGNPQLFAAAMPISGSADDYLGDHAAWSALKNTPVIIVHSYDDTVVPISAALNAAAALQEGGNEFLGYGAPTPCLWSPGSTDSPHDAWYTAFHKFEVVYNSLFVGDLEKTRGGTISPTTLYSHDYLGDGITQVWDYALGTSIVVEREDKAVLIDATMGHGGLYQYVRNNVLKNKDIPIEIFLTHQHNDHIMGIQSFIGSDQLKKVYVHKADSAAVYSLMGPDSAKVSPVKDDDLIPLGGKDIEVIGVPGHTLGSIAMKYDNYIFSGDSIGTGYVGVSAIPMDQYIRSVQHLLERMGPGKFTVYGGHTGELTESMTDEYVRNLLACAKGVNSNTTPARTYWRGGESATRKVSTVGSSSITYSINSVHQTTAALRGLRVSPGVLAQGYEPQFAPLPGNPAFATSTRTVGFASYMSYYFVTVNNAVNSLAITPTTQDNDYKSLTINGVSVRSGETYNAKLDDRVTRFAITVTATDGKERTYTLDVAK